ncbi:lead, cadmium, zinc and mercury transporting ATPase; copper-translocating P-type ATPase (plasmid) [Lacticaseibacillus paracasei]|nr:lead, cadmium, zinc and mercury transporting ATPase; copper-translocating P-type ATPase [Lacticaseibacillus paracasei]
MSGTVNGDAALTVKVTQRAEDSQYQGLLNWLRNLKRGQHILFGWLIVMRYHLR